jgi:hypothetical protein
VSTIAELRVLLDAATPGPWTDRGLTLRSFTIWDSHGDDLARAWMQADAALIVAAVTTFPALLDAAAVLAFHNLTPTGRIRKCLPECAACRALARLAAS